MVDVVKHYLGELPKWKFPQTRLLWKLIQKTLKDEKLRFLLELLNLWGLNSFRKGTPYVLGSNILDFLLTIILAWGFITGKNLWWKFLAPWLGDWSWPFKSPLTFLHCGKIVIFSVYTTFCFDRNVGHGETKRTLRNLFLIGKFFQLTLCTASPLTPTVCPVVSGHYIHHLPAWVNHWTNEVVQLLRLESWLVMKYWSDGGYF